NNQNELLRLALQRGIQPVADILMSIPEVHRLAVENNFYEGHDEQVDLRRIAQDHESSVGDLTAAEKKRLASITKNYSEFIQSSGVDNIFDSLLVWLSERYRANPSVLVREGEPDLVLPETWQDFVALDLTAKERA